MSKSSLTSAAQPLSRSAVAQPSWLHSCRNRGRHGATEPCSASGHGAGSDSASSPNDVQRILQRIPLQRLHRLWLQSVKVSQGAKTSNTDNKWQQMATAARPVLLHCKLRFIFLKSRVIFDWRFASLQKHHVFTSVPAAFHGIYATISMHSSKFKLVHPPVGQRVFVLYISIPHFNIS